MNDVKAVAKRFFDNLNNNGIGWARRFAADDMRWWVSGMGDLSKEKFLSVVGTVESLLAEPLKFTVNNIVSVGDNVFAEARVCAPLKNGKFYNNYYCFNFIVRDDEIYQVREYLDTRHVFDAFELED
jgi:ketosteroid isomerase-like protein